MLPLTVADDSQYRRVIGSLRRVRAAARQAYAVLFAAQAAGAEIQTDADGNVSVKPTNARAKEILTSVFRKGGKAPVYEMREWVLNELCPGIYSFVWDDLRRRVWTRWQAKDPKFPRAGMGWLALQNVRGLAVFRNTGVGFPTTVIRAGSLADHAVRLTWDREGGDVEFRIPKLEPARWHRWQQIVAGELEHGTILLN